MQHDTAWRSGPACPQRWRMRLAPRPSMQYTVHRVEASVSGLPEASFTTTELKGDVDCRHFWEWRPSQV